MTSSPSSFNWHLAQLFFPSYWLLSNITIGKRMENVERGINPVATTINKSSERILAETGIEPATSCSQVLNTIDSGLGLGMKQRLSLSQRTNSRLFQTERV